MYYTSASTSNVVSCFLYCYGDHRDLHVLTHSFPTRRSTDLLQPARAIAAASRVVVNRVRFVIECSVGGMSQGKEGLVKSGRLGSSRVSTEFPSLQSFPRKRDPSVFDFNRLKTLGPRFNGDDEQKHGCQSLPYSLQIGTASCE